MVCFVRTVLIDGLGVHFMCLEYVYCTYRTRCVHVCFIILRLCCGWMIPYLLGRPVRKYVPVGFFNTPTDQLQITFNT